MRAIAIRHAWLPSAVLVTGLAAPAATFGAADASGDVIEEVVVTARYREENLQDAPEAVTAFNEDMLAKLEAQDLDDVAPATPNVHIQPVVTFPNSAAIHIRGMGQQNIESTNEMRTGVSINGVFISRPIATLIDFFDVERVEVLRGPTGTTFGKNSLAGGLSIVTKRPDGSFDYHVEAMAGNYGRRDVRAAVQFPILGEQLSGRISTMFQNYDGHFTNRVNGKDLNGQDVDTVRGTLVWNPNERFEATLIGHYLKERSDAPGGDNDPDPGQIFQFTGPDDGTFTVGRDALAFHDTDQWSLTGLVDWKVGNFRIASVTGYVDTEGFIASDFDQTEVPFFPTFRDQVHDQFSQELRLHSQFADKGGWFSRLEFVLGLFYFEQEHELVQSFPTLGPSADYGHQDGDSRAVFGQAIYALTDRMNLTLGFRHTREQKDFERNPGVVLPQIDAQKPDSVPSIDFMSQQPMPVTGELDSENTTFEASVDYHFTDNLMAFAEFSQGFKAGEFGARAASEFTVGPTDDEESDSYEVGVKSEWFNGRLRANATAFHTNYENLQFGVFIPSPANPTGQETANQNIGEATNQGLELELTAVPVQRLTLTANVGLLDAEYDEFCADLDGPEAATAPVSPCGGRVVELPDGTFLVDEDFTDLELSRAPEVQAYLATDYRHPIRYGALFARVAGEFESEYFADSVKNNPKAETGNFWLMNARAGWESPQSRWRVAVWCKNCTDKTYVTGLTETDPFFNQKFYGVPRTYGATLSVRR